MARVRPGTQPQSRQRPPQPPPAPPAAWKTPPTFTAKPPAQKENTRSKEEWAAKDRLIVRQNALSHATAVVNTYCTTRVVPVELKLANMTQAVLNLAEVFERWVYRIAPITGGFVDPLAQATPAQSPSKPPAQPPAATSSATGPVAPGCVPPTETAAEAKEDLSKAPVSNTGVPLPVTPTPIDSTSPALAQSRIQMTCFPGRDGVPAPSDMSREFILKAGSKMSQSAAMADGTAISYALLCEAVWHLFGRWPSSEASVSKIADAVPLSKVCIKLDGVGA
jgi:hypothetical protein